VGVVPNGFAKARKTAHRSSALGPTRGSPGLTRRRATIG
jgi:hypothetical protein